MSISSPSSEHTICNETSIGHILQSCQSDERLHEFMEIVYSGNNIPWMLERNQPYSHLMKRGYRSIGDVISYLEGFSMIRTCGILHERDSRVNRKHYDAGNCPSQKGNLCCAHPEMSGLLFGVFAGLSIVNYFQPGTIDPKIVWECIAHLRKLDRTVASEDRKIPYWDKADITTGRSAELRSEAIMRQREIGVILGEQLNLILQELRKLTMSGEAIPQNTSIQILPQVPATIDVIMRKEQYV